MAKKWRERNWNWNWNVIPFPFCHSLWLPAAVCCQLTLHVATCHTLTLPFALLTFASCAILCQTWRMRNFSFNISTPRPPRWFFTWKWKWKWEIKLFAANVYKSLRALRVERVVLRVKRERGVGKYGEGELRLLQSAQRKWYSKKWKTAAGNTHTHTHTPTHTHTAWPNCWNEN